MDIGLKIVHVFQKALLKEIESHSIRLKGIVVSVDNVKLDFDRSVEGTLRIGSRLAVTEGEKQRIETAIQLLNYIIHFQDSESINYSEVKDMAASEIRKVYLLY